MLLACKHEAGGCTGGGGVPIRVEAAKGEEGQRQKWTLLRGRRSSNEGGGCEGGGEGYRPERRLQREEGVPTKVLVLLDSIWWL